MIWKFDYLNLYLSLRNVLNAENVDSLSYSQIQHIGKMQNEQYFSHYKKKVFFQWFQENVENTLSFSKKANKLVKKLELQLNGVEEMQIKNIEPREFTIHRALKIIEVPYKDKLEAENLSANAYFVYRGIRTYKKIGNHFETKYFGELFMTNKELVLYNRVKDNIDQVIEYDTIHDIELKSYSIIIKIINKPNVYLRYKDNELIFISLDRAINLKNDIPYKKNKKDEH